MTAPAEGGHAAKPGRLRTVGLSKTYGGSRALSAVSLEVGVGEVVALVGHNGAGKSTLSNILAGFETPDEGTLFIDGRAMSFQSPQEAIEHGVALVPQKLAVVPNLSVRHNLTLGTRRTAATLLADVVGELGLDHVLDEPAGRLPPATQRLVTLGRMLVREPRLLILDEPTSAFSETEVDLLFTIVRRMTARGISVIYISHRLAEILTIADRIIGMSQGHVIADTASHGLTRGDLADIVAGAPTRALIEAAEVAIRPDVSNHESRRGEVALSIRGLSTSTVSNLDLTIHRGEIVGLTGLVGAGRSSLLNTVWGSGERPAGGTIEVSGTRFAPTSPQSAIKRGVVYLPEGRQRTSLFPRMSVRENVTISSLRTRRIGRTPLMSRTRERSDVSSALDALNTQPAGAVDLDIGALSGGNQQKAILARWLLMPADVFLLDEPTEGVDVKARLEIHALLRRMADRRSAVLLSSSDIEEVVERSDRVLIMRAGAIVAELTGADRTVERVSRACLH